MQGPNYKLILPKHLTLLNHDGGGKISVDMILKNNTGKHLHNTDEAWINLFSSVYYKNATVFCLSSNATGKQTTQYLIIMNFFIYT